MTISECYSVLGIEQTHDVGEIKSAYKRQAMRLHPDRNQDPRAASFFMMAKEACDTLLLYEEIRQKYGMTLGKVLQDEETRKEAEVRERVRVAREKIEKKRAAEQELIDKIYKKYTRSWRVYLCGAMALVSLLIACLLVVDFAGNGEWEHVQVQAKRVSSWTGSEDEMLMADFFITLRKKELPVPADFFLLVEVGEIIEMRRTDYFGEVTGLRNSQGEALPYSFFSDAWLFIVFLLVIPALSFACMRRNFVFVFFFVHYNLYAQPLLILYVILGDARFTHLFASWFS